MSCENSLKLFFLSFLPFQHKLSHYFYRNTDMIPASQAGFLIVLEYPYNNIIQCFFTFFELSFLNQKSF